MKRFLRITVIGVFLYSILTIHSVSAQQFSPTVGISVTLKDSDLPNARPGLIVAKDPSQYYITRSYKDPNVAGIITDNTDFLYTIENDDGKTTLAVNGVTDVWVSNEFGNIKYGDFITTSTQTGIGVKAIENGAVIGYAMEAAPEEEGTHLIKVKLALTDAWTGGIPTENESMYKQSTDFLSNLFSSAGSEALQGSKGFLYLIVLLIVILASIFGFMTFGRIAVNGIYAVGRNPLAKQTIIRTILINSFITILFTLASFIIALLLIK
ncbi:MAG TPA: hypothetical protein PLS49_02855 [Candidatus Woesebacteria bacterium]|nr:hypothetical protein [Candidatus Woesebacteria bacterium]